MKFHVRVEKYSKFSKVFITYGREVIIVSVKIYPKERKLNHVKKMYREAINTANAHEWTVEQFHESEIG